MTPSPAGPAAPPRLIPAAPQQSWLELFYDLVFVATIVVLSTTFSNAAGIDGAIWLGLVFSLVWFTWLATTLLIGVGLVATLWTRALLVVQMVLVLAVAVVSDYSMQDNSLAVGPLFAAVLLSSAMLYLSARRSDPESNATFRGHAIRCAVAAVMFAVMPLFGWPWWYPGLWVVAILVFVVPAGSEVRNLRMDSHRLVHRFGEFTIIMLGEVFVKVGITATREPLDQLDLIGLPLATVVVFGIWWLYFTDVPEFGISGHQGRRLAWVYLHFPVHLGVIAAAVALAHTLVPEHDAGSHGGATIGSIQYVVIPVAVVLVSIGLIGVCSAGPAALVRHRLHVFLVAALILVVAEVVLLGIDSYDFQASAAMVTVVLAGAAWRIRRIGEPDG